jgi:hypothetical protein
MKLNKYNNFVFESTVYDLLLESNLIYMKDFRQILNDICGSEPKDSPVYKISNLLLRIAGKDMKLVQNYIDVDKESDKVSFIPDNRIQHESNIVKLRGIEDNRVINIVGDHSILDSCGISREGLLHPSRVSDIKVPNEWILLGTYDGSLHGDGFEIYTLHLLQNISDPTVRIVAFDNSSDGTSGIEGDLALPDVTKSSIKVGRFVNRILDIYFKENPNSDYGERGEYSAADVEKFVNKYTATALFMENAFDYFEIVYGEDIKYWYSEDKYAAKSSQLGNSCMRYNNCQDYFGIYNENPEVCKLLIFKNMNGDKIFGRALLWTDIDGQKLMDRVYTTKDNFMALFKKWAKENNYRSIYNEDISCTIKVESKDYKKYPYMDTFKYYSQEKGLLYNDSSDVERPYYRLEDTGGGSSFYEKR